MEYYAGLDLSLKEISICEVDGDCQTVARGTCPTDPDGVANARRIAMLMLWKKATGSNAKALRKHLTSDFTN